MKRVAIFMIRTSPCGEDARVSKMLFHYQALGLKVGITCISRDSNCSRATTELVSHKTLTLSKLSFLEKMPGLLRRIVLRIELLQFSLWSFFNFRAPLVHGCDLDGHLVGKFAQPWGVKRIFEVYDPWSTMTSSKRVARIEAREFQAADYLIMPALDSRIKVTRRNQMAFGNLLDIDLADQLLRNSEMDYIQLKSKLPPKYVLTGGTLGETVGTEKLIDFFRNHPEFELVIAGNLSANSNLAQNPMPTNVHIIGKQKWGVWLHLLRSSDACWAYYDPKIDHYASHISPNKYWESCLFDVPLIVSSMDQFCDRTNREPICLELLDDFLPRLHEGMLVIQGHARLRNSIQSEKDFWQQLQSMRTLAVSQMINTLNS